MSGRVKGSQNSSVNESKAHSRPVDARLRRPLVMSALDIDSARGGRPIGIEITAPALVSVAAMNRVLRELGQPTLRKVDLSPLLAA